MLSNRYEIRQILGEGSTSTVYLAYDRQENSEVAVKSLLHGSSNEHKIHSQVDYEHIAKLKNYIPGQRHSYLIFERCDCNLISFINGYDIDLKCALRITRMVLLACRYLHHRGIIHRDIKLGNILVKNNTIKICDFGLSCYETENDFSYCGTKDYLAPEIERANIGGDRRGYGKKVDIYAVGVVLKVLLTRRKGVPVEEINSVSADIRRFLAGLLKEDQQKRFSADEALKDTVFDCLFTETPDFRLIKPFHKVTKYGEIRRVGNWVKICYSIKSQVQEGNPATEPSEIMHELLIEYSSRNCNCTGALIASIKIDGLVEERAFLTNTQLLYYNYLCSYLKALCAKTPKIKLEEDGHAFVLYVDGSYSYTFRNFTINRRGGQADYLVNGKEVSTIPLEAENITRYFKQKCDGKDYACVCGQRSILESGSTINVSLNNGLCAKEYEFIKEFGWCIRNNLCFIFLLNTGKTFTVNARQSLIVDDGHIYPIAKNIPDSCKQLLIIVRHFLLKFKT